MRFPVLSSKAVSRQTAKQSAFLRIQVRASSQTKGLERGWKQRERLGREARFARKTLTPRFTDFFTDFEKKKPTVLQSSFTLDLWQTTSASTTRQWEIQKQRFGRQYTVFFFPDFLSTQNRVRVIEGEFIWKDLRGNKNYFELAGGSSYRGVKLQ